MESIMRVVAHIAPGPAWLPGRSVFEQGKSIAAHRSFMQAMYDDGTLLLGGPARDGMSGLAVLEVPDLATARALAAADPGVVADVLVYDVHELLPFFDVLGDGRSSAALNGTHAR
jgi:uncharacterized protein YciI